MIPPPVSRTRRQPQSFIVCGLCCRWRHERISTDGREVPVLEERIDRNFPFDFSDGADWQAVFRWSKWRSVTVANTSLPPPDDFGEGVRLATEAQRG
jgi:hypothetical protein